MPGRRREFSKGNSASLLAHVVCGFLRTPRTVGRLRERPLLVGDTNEDASGAARWNFVDAPFSACKNAVLSLPAPILIRQMQAESEARQMTPTTDSNLLSESLKTLRFLHRILMLAAAAILILAVAPDPSRNYRAALRELGALSELQANPTNEYEAYLGRYVHASDGSLSEFLSSALRDAGARVPGRVEMPKAYVIDLPLNGGRVTDYDAYFSGEHEVAPLELSRNGMPAKALLVGFLKEQIGRWAGSRQRVVFKGLKIVVTGMGELPSGAFVQYFRNLPADHRPTGILQFDFAVAHSIQESRFNVPIPVTFALGSIRKEQFALSWLQSTILGKQLVDPKTRAVFPKLKELSFWRRLSLMEVAGAISYLRERLDSINAETISFFGFSVSKNLALWAGPMLCFLLEWLFFLHFRNFRERAESTDEAITGYPWIAVFPGWLCESTLYLSLFALPLAPNVIVLLRFGRASRLSTQVGVGFTILTLVLSAFLLRKVWQFRRDSESWRGTGASQ